MAQQQSRHINITIEEYIDIAIDKGRDIALEYMKYDGTMSTRTISNVRVSEEFGYGYISAFCHLRNEDRTFKISRIRKIDGIPVCEFTGFQNRGDAPTFAHNTTANNAVANQTTATLNSYTYSANAHIIQQQP